MNEVALNWVEVVGGLLFSWQFLLFILLLIYRKPIRSLIQRFTRSEEGKAELGPLKIELGHIAEQGQEAVEVLQRINVLMGKSRLLELEITEDNFSRRFSPEQQERMDRHIEEFEQLLEEAQSLEQDQEQ